MERVRTLATMNEAVHGIELEPAVATEALRVAEASITNPVAVRGTRS